MSGKAGVFICPSCQAVVRSDTPLSEGVTCGECLHEFKIPQQEEEAKEAVKVPTGRQVTGSGSVVRDLTAKKSPPIRAAGVLDLPKVAVKSMEQAKAETAGVNSDDEMIMPDGSRRVRRRKKKEKTEKNKGLVLFLGGWFCVIIIVVAVFSKTGKSDKEKEGPDKEEGSNAIDLAILKKSIPQITKDFKAFLGASSDSRRVQFIDRSADLSTEFSKFYRETTFPRPESELNRIGANVVRPSENQIAVETLWVDEKGNKWGALHIFDKNEGWKLDWENFAPLSSESWAKFRAELGSEEGVFRLLVRKREIDREDKKISLSFYRAPGVFESGDEYQNTESPVVDVRTESELGQEFLRLWTEHSEGRPPMGSLLGKLLDPDSQSLMRITVRLAWEGETDKDRVMVLKEIVGPGWFGTRIQNLRKEARKVATDEALKNLSTGGG